MSTRYSEESARKIVGFSLKIVGVTISSLFDMEYKQLFDSLRLLFPKAVFMNLQVQSRKGIKKGLMNPCQL